MLHEDHLMQPSMSTRRDTAKERTSQSLTTAKKGFTTAIFPSSQ